MSADVSAVKPGKQSQQWRVWLPASRIITILSFVVGVVLWEMLARTSSSPIFVSIVEIARSAMELLQDGTLYRNLRASGQSFILGYTLAVVVGVALGVMLGLTRLLRQVLEPWLYAFYSIPIVAIAPIFIIAFGIGTGGHIVVVFTLTFFAITVNTMAGIETADQQYVEVARAYNGDRFEIVRYVLLPSAVPFILTGMRLGVTRALIGVVVAELFGARAGIGYMILAAQQRFDISEMYVGVAVLAIAGMASTYLLGRFEQRLATWRPDHES